MLPGQNPTFVIEHTVVVSGNIADFDQAAYINNLAGLLGVDPSQIVLTIVAGSAVVTATISTPQSDVGDAIVDKLAPLTVHEMNSVFGITVESITPPSKRTLYPPSPPLPPRAPPPPPPGPPGCGACDCYVVGDATAYEVPRGFVFPTSGCYSFGEMGPALMANCSASSMDCWTGSCNAQGFDFFHPGPFEYTHAGSDDPFVCWWGGYPRVDGGAIVGVVWPTAAGSLCSCAAVSSPSGPAGPPSAPPGSSR